MFAQNQNLIALSLYIKSPIYLAWVYFRGNSTREYASRHLPHNAGYSLPKNDNILAVSFLIHQISFKYYH